MSAMCWVFLQVLIMSQQKEETDPVLKVLVFSWAQEYQAETGARRGYGRTETERREGILGKVTFKVAI